MRGGATALVVVLPYSVGHQQFGAPMRALAFFAAWSTTLGEGRLAGAIEESTAGTRGVDVAPAEDLC